MPRATPSLHGDADALSVDRVITELRRGRVIRVRGLEGSALVASVEMLSADLLAALFDAADGTLRLATTAERAAALGWSATPGDLGWPVPLATRSEALLAAAGATTAADAASPTPAAQDLTPATTLERAALQLAKHARLLPTMLCARDRSAPEAPLLQVTTAAIAAYQEPGSVELEFISEVAVPLFDAPHARLAVYRDRRDASECVAVKIGDIDLTRVVEVRVHSACMTGDLLGSLRCDCGDQLRSAIRRFAQLGGGVLLYVGQEGRGIGLVNKLRAYALQDNGLDTIDADRHLGFVGDERRYGVAAALLQALGISQVRLHTNNPRKIRALTDAGIDVAGFRTLAGAMTPQNESYIRVRRARAGHLTPDPE